MLTHSRACRLNTKLETRSIAPMTSLTRDLSDGVRLVELMEIMGDTSLGRFYRSPRMRVQMAENVNLALDFIRARGVVLTNVGAEGQSSAVQRRRASITLTLTLKQTSSTAT